MDLKDKIFTIRGKQVMLDSDLAKLYEVKAIKLREQVKRNKERFPSDFMFQLTENEINFMVSQFAIPSKQQFGGYLPYVFTEQGGHNL
ncbi:MAG: ORF6N domain-containing protein [DPANN group archaeon]|nr:ORF6N domain-containing protein [DPANN group archaeon]